MGDSYCAAVVEALSRKVIINYSTRLHTIPQELDAMDELNEKLRLEDEEKTLLSMQVKRMQKSPSSSSNGSRVAVPDEVRRQ